MSDHGKMDDGINKGLDAGDCARQILLAIEKNEPETFIAGKEILAVYLKRFAPNLFTKFISKAKLT